MTILWAGLAVGAIYTLVALGYNIPLAQTGIFNFAQGQIVVFGTFFAWFVMGDLGWPWWVAIVGGAAAGGLIAAVEELLAIRPVVAKGSHALLVTTVGAAVIIEGVLLATWGSTTRSVNFFAGNNGFSLLGGRLLPVDLWLIAAAVVISFGLHAVSRYTLWGLAGRAATDDMAAAVVRGVNVTRLRMSAFVLAGALGGALGPLIGPVAGIDVSTGITLTIYGFVALALAGLWLATRKRPPRLARMVTATLGTSVQLAVRMSMLIVVFMLWVALGLGIDALVGAFSAGIIVKAFLGTGERAEAEIIESKLEGIGFGFLVPFFFVMSGIKLDLKALFASPADIATIPLFLVLFLVVRGLPTLVLHRKDVLAKPARAALALFASTQLPMVVVITSIGVQTNAIKASTAAAIVTAGVLSVLIFPLIGLRLASRELALE